MYRDTSSVDICTLFLLYIVKFVKCDGTNYLFLLYNTILIVVIGIYPLYLTNSLI